MNRSTIATVASLVFLVMAIMLPYTAFADTVEDLLQSAVTNYKNKDYAKALEDLNWAKKEITNKHMEVVKALLPESLPGYETQHIDGGAALGFQNISRDYVNGDKHVKISISSGDTSDTGAGLGALVNMAAAFQAMDGSTKSNLVIVQGHKGQFNLEPDSKHGTLTLSINSKAYVSIETWGFDNSDEAKKAAEKLDFDKIEKSFQ